MSFVFLNARVSSLLATLTLGCLPLATQAVNLDLAKATSVNNLGTLAVGVLGPVSQDTYDFSQVVSRDYSGTGGLVDSTFLASSWTGGSDGLTASFNGNAPFGVTDVPNPRDGLIFQVPTGVRFYGRLYIAPVSSATDLVFTFKGHGTDAGEVRIGLDNSGLLNANAAQVVDGNWSLSLTIPSAVANSLFYNPDNTGMPTNLFALTIGGTGHQMLDSWSIAMSSPSVVPEAASWQLMALGLGLCGAAMSRRRQLKA
jgi:PEP-CTERM motif